MILDQELIRAVDEAVEEAGQPVAVASRIKAWLEGMSKGDNTPSDVDDYLKMTLSSIRTQYTGDEE